MRTRFLAGFVTTGFLLTSLVFAADQPKKNSKESDDMARAIAFERHKDAAAARQARIEAKHPSVTYYNSDADRSSDQNANQSKTQNDKSKR